MTTHYDERVNAVVDVIDWQLSGTGIMPEGIARNAVNAVKGADEKSGLVSVEQTVLDEVKAKLLAISTRSTADLQTIMWAKQAIKLLGEE